MTQTKPPAQGLFYSYLLLLCWVPLPLASQSLLAREFFICLTALLSLSACCFFWRNPEVSISSSLHRARWLLVLFIISLLWLLLQTLPLPTELLLTLSPKRFSIYQGQYNLDQFSSITSAPLSFDRWNSKLHILLSLTYLQIFVLTLLLVNSRERLKLLLYIIVAMSAFQAAYGGLMTLSGMEKHLWYSKTDHLGVATGTLLNRNHLANFLTYGSAAGIALLLASLGETPSAHNWRQHLRNITQWLLGGKGAIRIALIIMVIGLILTRSRMGNTAFFVSLTSTGLLWLILTRKFNRNTMILFASLLVIDILLMGSLFGFDELEKRIESTNAEQELRAKALPYLYQMSKDFYLTGFGPGNFSRIFPLYDPGLTYKFFNEVHFDYLQFVMEFGLLGTLPLALIVLLSFGKACLLLKQSHSRLTRGVCFAVIMALSASCLHATVEYNWQRLPTTVLLIIFLALPWIAASLKSHHSRRPAKRKLSVPLTKN